MLILIRDYEMLSSVGNMPASNKSASNDESFFSLYNMWRTGADHSPAEIQVGSHLILSALAASNPGTSVAAQHGWC